MSADYSGVSHTWCHGVAWALGCGKSWPTGKLSTGEVRMGDCRVARVQIHSHECWIAERGFLLGLLVCGHELIWPPCHLL